MVRDFLLACIVLVAYCGWALVFPTRCCRSCHGVRVTLGRKPGICKPCKGTGRTARLGGAAIHRFFWSVVHEIQEQHRNQQERAERSAR